MVDGHRGAASQNVALPVEWEPRSEPENVTTLLQPMVVEIVMDQRRRPGHVMLGAALVSSGLQLNSELHKIIKHTTNILKISRIINGQS